MRPALLINSTIPGKGNSCLGPPIPHTGYREQLLLYTHGPQKGPTQGNAQGGECAWRGLMREEDTRIWGLHTEKKEVHIERAYIWWAIT